MPALISSVNECRDWRQRLVDSNYRGVLIYEGESEPTPELLSPVQSSYCAIARHNQNDTSDTCLSSRWPRVQAKQLLGATVDTLLFDCRAGFDYALSPAMLAAAVGALRGGGLLVLWWPAQAMQARKSRFERRLHSFISDLTPSVLARLSPDLVTEAATQNIAGVVEETAAEAAEKSAAKPIAPALDTLAAEAALRPNVSPNLGQVALIEAVEQLAKASVQREADGQHTRSSKSFGQRALVLRADRGRGKTWALGRAVLDLQHKPGFEKLRVAITAPRKSAVAAALAVANGEASGENNRRALAYWAPDALLLEKPCFDLLLIDEAAAIPPAVLAALFEQYRFCVFSTTLNGYEGSGKGFELRFAEYLAQHCENLHSISLQAPIRWAEGDPLEAALNAALLMDMNTENKADAKPSAMLADASAKQVIHRRLSKADLAADEVLLRQCFGLLLNAHYQTSPDDLRLLLDAESLELWVAETRGGDGGEGTHSNTVLAVAMIMREGPIAPALAAKVRSGKRRLRGELIPQSILYYADTDAVRDRVFARVLRIAVDKHQRRLGLGRALLNAAEQALQQDNEVAGIGASYAADLGTNAFWFSGGYQPIRLGLRRDPCSGSHSLLVLKVFHSSFNAEAETLLRECSERFAGDLDSVLARLPHFPAAQAEQLRRQSLGPSDLAEPPEEASSRRWDLRQARRFANGEIPWEQALPSLLRLGPPPGIGTAEQQAWKQCCEPQINWSAVAASLSVPGRKAVESVLRCAAQNYSSFS